jgi:hypothetical protein
LPFPCLAASLLAAALFCQQFFYSTPACPALSALQVAAYLLDHDRFARVPHTVMVKMTHPIFHVTPQPQQQQAKQEGEEGGAAAAAPLQPPQLPCKLGSLQQFVPHECDTSEMGASRFR